MSLPVAAPGTSRDRLLVLALGGLVLAWGLPELPFRRIFPGDGFSAGREIMWWLIALLVLGHVRFVEGRPLASIGLRRPTVRTFALGVGVALAMFAIVVATYAIVFQLLGLAMNHAATAGITRNPIWFQLLLALRAGVVEEIVYRGYPIARIAELTGSRWIAVAVSVVVFTAVHIGYWGGAQLLIVAPGAVILGLLFVWRRDLVCNMVAHVLVDTAGFLAATLQS